ncbi:hypothetical protein GH810_14250 [Acetobacterium paludosum]|uniref:Recombinase RecT n=1 Tax=Acetobacterium paludosum TaxID=52693 RepID=A0A923KXK7_9FIRM|nr:hypothetical protein [Acetobacterium paludosum]MBC3889473.1 hypothetical protein [Acetobacterium paludosum]
MAENSIIVENGVEKKPRRELKNISFNDGIFSGSDQFSAAMKMAMYLSKSTIIPKEFQGNEGNILIALEMSNRLGVGLMMVMQNLYVVNGRPSWSSQYIIAMINSSKKYKTELQYHMEGTGDDLSCYAYAEDYSGHEVKGPTITIEMSKKEGWYGKNGSKWPNMPEIMIKYRAASSFGRINCPDMIMGIYSTEEVVDGMVDYQILNPEESVKQEIESNANSQTLDFDNTDNKKEAMPEKDKIKDKITPEEIKAIEEAELETEQDDDLPDFMK